jgi:hypothetical protein
MPENNRPHLAMGIIILILALVLIVLTFVPKPAIRIQGPNGGGIYSTGMVVPSFPIG